MIQPSVATMIWRAEHLSEADRTAADRAAAAILADAARLVARVPAACRRVLRSSGPRPAVVMDPGTTA